MSATRAPHILVVTDTGEDYPSYSLECPGVTDWCREWRTCDPCSKRAAENEDFDEELHDAEEAHGVEHRKLMGDWMTPTGHCLATIHDGIADEGETINDKPGRYPVHVTFEDDGDVLLLEPADAVDPMGSAPAMGQP